MKNQAVLALFLFGAVLASFSGAEMAYAASADCGGETVPFVPVDRGSYGGVTERRFLVVTNEDEWKNLWAEINGNVLPLPPRPEVDFSKRALAAVFQGLKRSGGYSITVDSIVETGDRLTVSVREQEPGPRSLVTMALSSPWEVVAFPLPAKPVIFTSVP